MGCVTARAIGMWDTPPTGAFLGVTQGTNDCNLRREVAPRVTAYTRRRGS